MKHTSRGVMLKKIITAMFLLIVTALAYGKSGPRFDGIYKIGEVGDYQFSYVMLNADKTISMLNKFKNDDIAAYSLLQSGKANDGWHYSWGSNSLSYYKNTETMHLNGRFELADDNFIKNSVFLIFEDGKVKTTLRPEAQKPSQLYQLVNLNGEAVNKEKYALVRAIPNTSAFLVKLGDKFKIVDNTGKALSNEYARIEEFREDFAAYYDEVTAGWGLLDKSGTPVLVASQDGIELSYTGVTALLKDGYWTIIDRKLKPLIQDHPTQINLNNEIIAYAQESDKGWSYVTPQGKKLAFKGITKNPLLLGSQEYYVTINEEKKTLVIDKLGNIITTFNGDYVNVYPINSKRFIVCKGDRSCGIINEKEQSVLPMAPNPILPLIDSASRMSRNGEELLDQDGNKMIDKYYLRIHPTDSNYILLDSRLPTDRRSCSHEIYYKITKKFYDLGIGCFTISSNKDFITFRNEGEGEGVMRLSDFSVVIPPTEGYITISPFQYFIAHSTFGKIKTKIYNFQGDKIFETDKQIDSFISEELALTVDGSTVDVLNIKTGKLINKSSIKRAHFYNGAFIKTL